MEAEGVGVPDPVTRLAVAGGAEPVAIGLPELLLAVPVTKAVVGSTVFVAF